MIALDIGGTLLSDDNTITPKNLKIIQEVKNLGVRIALATAREYSSTKYISRQIKADYGVFSNGSHLVDLNNLNTIKCSFIEQQAVLDIYNYCKEKNLYIHLNQEFCEVSDQMKYFNLKHNILNSNYPAELKSECFLVKNLYEYIKSNKITKIVIVSEQKLDDNINELQAILKKYHLFITEYNQNLYEHIINKTINYIEIGSSNETKASGLCELSRILNIPKEEILVVGDGNNDLEMLNEFPNSVCMNNGSVKAKKIVKYVTTKDNNNSGVAEGISYYIRGVEL